MQKANNDMKRRNFLKRIGQTIAGVVVAPKALAVIPKQDTECHPFEPLRSMDDFEVLMKRVHDRCEGMEYLRQDIIRSEKEHEEIIRAMLKKHNFPKEHIMG